jgi:hypothetical protein
MKVEIHALNSAIAKMIEEVKSTEIILKNNNIATRMRELSDTDATIKRLYVSPEWQQVFVHVRFVAEHGHKLIYNCTNLSQTIYGLLENWDQSVVKQALEAAGFDDVEYDNKYIAGQQNCLMFSWE